jgi:threonine dehydrogenase-like Zn-dependent dehydrogenase
MRAAVTQAVGSMELLDLPEPQEPAEGEVIVRPDAVGICGSDYHFFLGELSPEAGGGQFPRIQGHEVSATIEQLGPGCRPELRVGGTVAVWPLSSCGHCYPCRVGRGNVCDNFSLVGIHSDGGLQERLGIPQAQVFPIDAPSPQIAALTEPVSIAVRAVRRARIEAEERVVVLGAGPIGQAVQVVSREHGATPLLVDPVHSRIDLSQEMGAEAIAWEDASDVVSAAREWAGGEGPPAVIDATGAADAVRAAVDMVASAGRVTVVGMSGEEVSLRVGSFVEKELDMLGVSCCGGDEFAEAVAVVEKRGELLQRLISHEFPLERAPEALEYAIEHPHEVMKVVIRGASDL